MSHSADLHTLSQSGDHGRSIASGRAGQTAVVPRPSSRWRTRVLIPSVVIVATLGVLGYAARSSFQPSIDVVVASVVPKSMQGDDPVADGALESARNDAPAGAGDTDAVLAQAPGWIEPAPFAVGVPALADGVVREVLALEGESVDAGEVVVRLDGDDAKLALRASDAEVAQREADAARARAAVATAESQVRIERSKVAELRDEVSRKRELADVGGISAGEFRRMEIRLEGVEAGLASAERLFDEARVAITQAEAGVATAAVARDQARLLLERMDVRSPVAGVVLSRLVEPGARLTMAASSSQGAGMSGVVLRVYDPSQLQVRVDVTLADAAKITVGTRATITTEALPDSSFSGSVTRVVHEANIQRNTVQFKVTLENPSPILKPEMLTRVRFHAASRGNATTAGPSGGLSLLIPVTALIDARENAASVWIVDTTTGVPLARRQAITTASSHDEGFVIATSGVRITDRVVIDPPEALRNGIRLRIPE